MTFFTMSCYFFINIEKEFRAMCDQLNYRTKRFPIHLLFIPFIDDLFPARTMRAP